MNCLPQHRVDALIRCFDEGLGIRATARETGVSRETVGRYHRRWRRRAPASGSVMPALDPATAAALSAEARRRGESPSAFAARLLAAVLDQRLVTVVLA